MMSTNIKAKEGAVETYSRHEQAGLRLSDRQTEDIEDWSDPEEESRKYAPAQREQYVQRPRGKKKKATCKELKQSKKFRVAGVWSSSGRVKKDETD